MISTNAELASISLNKLAEYIDADATRRKRIVWDAKNPKQFVTTRYREVRPLINQYFRGLKDDFDLFDAIEDFKSDKTGTEWQKNDRSTSVESLEHFLNLEKDLVSDSRYDFAAPEDYYHLIINGVKIKVNPDLIVYFTVRGVRNVGALKIHISKSNTLSDYGQKVVGAVLHECVKEHIAEDGDKANPKLCFSSDIFKEKIEFSPASHKLIMKEVSNACTEIALWWASI
jgi:hypothetical protein